MSDREMVMLQDTIFGIAAFITIVGILVLIFGIAAFITFVGILVLIFGIVAFVDMLIFLF